VCLAILYYRCVPGAPVAVAANREEHYDRAAEPPHWWSGAPIFAGRDRRARGTWLGVSAGGLLAAVTNRRQQPRAVTAERRSRGLLCADALLQPTAAAAVTWLERHLTDRHYDPFNLVVADATSAHVAHWDGCLRLAEVPPGLHLLSDTDLDDPGHSRLCRARRLLAGLTVRSWPALAPGLCALLGNHGQKVAPHDRMCRHLGRAGTVSASLVSLSAAGLTEARYLYADGPPCTTPFANLSSALRSGLPQR